MYKKKEFNELVEVLSEHNLVGRNFLRELIIKIYGITDAHSVNGKITLLIAKGKIKRYARYNEKDTSNTIYQVVKNTTHTTQNPEEPYDDS